VHFDKDQIPPANAFWSLTLYNNKNFLAKNKFNKYAIHVYDKLYYNDDGSIDILVQNKQPKERLTNWLPSPLTKFMLLIRIYLTKKKALDGRWNPPIIKQILKEAIVSNEERLFNACKS